MEEFRNELISRIRSCLISTKGQVSLRQLEVDYRTLIGERIPFARLGFKNLESFLATVPTLILQKSADGEIWVDAKVSEQSAHISSMVRKQKAAPAKKKTNFHRHNNNNNNNTTTNGGRPAVLNKWRAKNVNVVKKNHQYPPRLSTFPHNQFVSVKNTRVSSPPDHVMPKVPSKIVVPERRPMFASSAPSMSPTLPSNNTSTRSSLSSPTESTSNNSTESCPALSSCKRRISKMMGEMQLTERDSGNSSPTAEYAAVQNKAEFDMKAPVVQEFIRTDDPLADLYNFAAFHKLGQIEIKYNETKTKKSKVLQHCIIKVDKHTYLSYPEDFATQEGAAQHAAKKAMDDLFRRYSHRKSLLVSSVDDVLERVPPMLEKHLMPIWSWQIEDDYIDKYHEQLPIDWLRILDQCPSVSYEKYQGRFVVQHCKPEDVLQKGKKLDHLNLNEFHISVPCNTVQFESDKNIYAFITYAVAADEVWCQQSSTEEHKKFVTMCNNMEEFYNQNKGKNLAAKTITYGGCYVIHHEDAWYRVRAVGSIVDDHVDCFLIDYGEQFNVHIDNIYYLKREYAIEAQAFACRLVGLEELYDVSNESEHLTALIDREVVLEMVTEDSNEVSNLTIPVVMYDSITGASINKELISRLTLEAATPILDKNIVSEVHVSNIEPNGDVYIQLRTCAFDNLAEMLRTLSLNINRNKMAYLLEKNLTKESAVDRLFLIKDSMSDLWLRIRFLDWSPIGNLAQIYYVDYGNTNVIDLNKVALYPLDKLNDILNQYPAQAVKVRIMIETIPKDFVERCGKFMPIDHKILLKIISYDNENVAWVEFFKRNSDGGLFCVNKSISMESELASIDSTVNQEKNAGTNRLVNLAQFNSNKKNVPSGGCLKKPNLPKKGEFFNINIPFAVNPWNFFVQPLETLEELTKMMEEMQVQYNSNQYHPLHIDDVIPGNIYASKHDDGLWYRTNVLKVIHTCSISVFYCDFGYYTNLSLRQLVPLDLKYMNLPYQAVKAKFSGIKPIKNKWSVEDCEVFKNLVTKKQFVSILVDVEKDEFYRSDIVLKLLLIDTSGEEDVHIKDLLVHRGIALSV